MMVETTAATVVETTAAINRNSRSRKSDILLAQQRNSSLTLHLQRLNHYDISTSFRAVSCPGKFRLHRSQRSWGVILIILNVDIAKRFGNGVGFAIGMILLPFIFWPILG